jgi:ribonuclease HI
MQMDMTYATVPVFGGELKRMYREIKFSYVVNDHNNLMNHPIYVVDEDLGCCILSINEEYNETPMLEDPLVIPVEEVDGILKLFFDGACSSEGFGVGIVLISPTKREVHLSYKLEFKATNNVVEYEALILGLEATRKMQITRLVVFGDSNLVVQQVRGSYQTRHPRMRAYTNQVWDIIGNFYVDFNIYVVLKELNQPFDSLAVVASTFKVPTTPQFKYEIEVRYKPSSHDNIKYWQVFEDDQQIKKFMQVIDEFANTHIDSDDEQDTKHEIEEEVEDIPKFRNHMAKHKVS